MSVIAPGAQAAPKGQALGWARHHEVATTAVSSVLPYDPFGLGEPAGNGNGGGEAVGKPCAGCVGNADDKNPTGQLPGPGEPNVGYECDGNNGIARTNPAHTGCDPGTTTTETPTTTTTEVSTTTTAPTTTTEAVTTTTSGATVLGVQLTRGDELARTGGLFLSPLFALGVLLAVAGAVMVLGQPQRLRVGRRSAE